MGGRHLRPPEGTAAEALSDVPGGSAVRAQSCCLAERCLSSAPISPCCPHGCWCKRMPARTRQLRGMWVLWGVPLLHDLCLNPFAELGCLALPGRLVRDKTPKAASCTDPRTRVATALARDLRRSAPLFTRRDLEPAAGRTRHVPACMS